MINTRGTISRALADLKREKGVELSIEELARRVEISKDMLYRLDFGETRRIDLDLLDRICVALKKSPDYILGFSLEQRR